MAPVRVSPADVGRRVTVRHVDPADGLGTDVVGVLEAWEGGLLTVRRRDGTSATVPAGAVVAARVVPPEVAAYQVQALADDGWRAQDRERLGPWLLRWDHGVTHRANSVLVTDPPADLPALLDRAVAWYAARGARAQLLVTEPWPGDADLDRLGWGWGTRAEVLTAPTPDLVRRLEGTAGPRIELADSPGPHWLVLVDGMPEQQHRVLASILTRAPTRVFATAYGAEGDVLGIGRASLDRLDGLAWACLTNLNTAPSARRQGVAQAVTAALAAWALAQRASTTYLQVERDNAPARRLYDSLGFVRHHRYAYRVAPDRLLPR